MKPSDTNHAFETIPDLSAVTGGENPQVAELNNARYLLADAFRPLDAACFAKKSISAKRNCLNNVDKKWNQLPSYVINGHW